MRMLACEEGGDGAENDIRLLRWMIFCVCS